MEHTKLPLTTWFLAIHLISQAKTVHSVKRTRRVHVRHGCVHLFATPVGKLNVAMRQSRHFNGHGQLVEVNQIEDGFPETWRQQQCQAQDDDDIRCALSNARPQEQRRAGG